MLANGINVNQRSNARRSFGSFTDIDISESPLESAVSGGLVDAVKILLAHGAVVSDKCVGLLKGVHKDEIAALLAESKARMTQAPGNFDF